jgi:hypothetical protein
MARNPTDAPLPGRDGSGTPEGSGQRRDENSPVLAEGPHDRVDGGNAAGRAALSFDDDEIGGERGNTTRMGGTANAIGGDSGELRPPAEIQNDRVGPSETAPDPG